MGVFQLGCLAIAVCAGLLAGCSAEHEEYGFSSRVEMDLANRNGFLTKARMDLSMTPLPVARHEIVSPPSGPEGRAPEKGRAAQLLTLCGAPYSCAMAMAAAAQESDTAMIHAGVSRILQLPQGSRGGGSGHGADMPDMDLARLISSMSRADKAAGYSAFSEAVQADPRRSGLWLGMAVYQAIHGDSEDAWASVWLSWYFAADRVQAVERIKDMFYAETNAAAKSAYGRAMLRINAGQAPQLEGRPDER